MGQYMKQLINKDIIVEEIKRKIEAHKETLKNCDSNISEMVIKGSMSAYQSLLHFLDTIETKEVDTWHLQKNEDIYDAVNDWSLHSFICLMDDGSVQKFTGILSECYDGSVNLHIDATNDEYSIDNIIFWIEAPKNT